MTRNEIQSLIIDILKEIGEDQDNPALQSINTDSRLYGEVLDSLGIVLLASELEEAMYDDYDLPITIVDERAMSEKTSPFLSVKILARYVEKLLNDVGEK